MKKHLILLSLWLVASSVKAQLETAQWISGLQPYKASTALDTGFHNDFGANILDFRKSPLGISRKFKTLPMFDCNISMCDSQGEILFFSNGAKIFNRYDSLIEGGDSLSPSRIWELGWGARLDEDYYSNTEYSYAGGKQALIAIPRPSYPNQFYIINFYLDMPTSQSNFRYWFTKVNYSILNMNLNNGRGKLILKEKTMLVGIFSPILSACKHGDGKNWWITTTDGMDKNSVYIFKATKDSVFFVHTNKYNVKNLSMGAAFSPDGKYYATAGIDSGVNVFQFNRCNGQMTFLKYLKRNHIDSNTQFPSLCFSPNSRFLYHTVAYSLYQYDLLANNDSCDRIKINQQDTILMYQMQQAIDNKLYMSTGSGSTNLHTIENPNEKGLACNFKINSIALKTWNRGIPQFPNYTLGADTCYTNSIHENHLSEIAIYPNPASNKVIIQISSDLNPPMRLYITDIQGRVYLNEQITENSKQHEFYTAKWAEGTYFINLYNNKKLVTNQKLSIIH